LHQMKKLGGNIFSSFHTKTCIVTLASPSSLSLFL
jgi:hypothetical protein